MKKILLLALVAVSFVIASCAAPTTTDTGVATTSPAEQLLKLKILKGTQTEEPVAP